MSNKDSNTVKTQKAWGEAYLSRHQDPHQKFAELMDMPRQQAAELALRMVSEAPTLPQLIQEAEEYEEYLDSLPSLGDLLRNEGMAVIGWKTLAESLGGFRSVAMSMEAHGQGREWTVARDATGRLLLITSDIANIDWNTKVELPQ